MFLRLANLIFLHLTEMLIVSGSHKISVDGLRVGILSEKSNHPLISRVEEALMLIRQHDPFRYHKIKRDIGKIWIVTTLGSPANGDFTAALHRCRLKESFVRSASLEQIASTIVHEATHAHPCLRKINSSDATRYRIEGICMRQELAFAQTLPDGQALCALLEKNLVRDPMIWSDDAMARAFIATNIADWQGMGTPPWLMRIVQAAVRWRIRIWLRRNKQD
jgi:hypothetical protein